MKRVKLIVAYDGTNYSGWQIQPNGITIEEILNRQISKLTGEDIRIIGASRTDSGVHALGNVAVFDTESRIPGDRFAYALNQKMPEDIVIVRSDEVQIDWHPRYQNEISKTYEYHIYNAKVRNPLKNRYSTFVSFDLDVEKMRQGAKYILGEHDFASFCGNPKMKKSTVREIYSIDISLKGSYLNMTFHGSGFLQYMVRILSGTLLEVGFGKREADSMQELLEAKNRSLAGATAPAKGLSLLKVHYANQLLE